MLKNNVIRLIVPFLLLSSFVVWSGPYLLDEINQYNLRKQLEKEVQALFEGISDAKARAFNESRRYGVELTLHDWNIFLDQGVAWQKDPQDIIVRSGDWHENTKIGKLLVGPIFYEKQSCYIDVNTFCKDAMESEDEIPSVIAITSDARRIYTLYLPREGDTDLVYDDY